MKINITRNELKLMATGFSKIVPGTKGPACCGLVRLSVRNSILTAQATDLDQTATFQFEKAEGDGTGEVFIPFQTLRDLAKGTPTEKVTIVSLDDNSVSVTNPLGEHSVTTTLQTEKPADWPADQEDIPVSEAIGFLPSFRKIAPFASADATRPMLCGVLVDTNSSGDHPSTLVATDGRRLTCFNSLRLPLNEKDGIIIPVTRFLLWNDLPNKVDLGIAKTQGQRWVCIKAGPWTYVTKTLNGCYPNWRQVFPKVDPEANRIEFTDADALALGKIIPALPCQSGQVGVISLQGQNGSLHLGGTDSVKKAYTVPLTGGSVYSGPGCTLYVDKRFLLQALNAGFRRFLFSGAGSPLLSRDEHGGTHLLMPIRTEQTPEPNPATPTPEAPATTNPENTHVESSPGTPPQPAAQPETHQEKANMNTDPLNTQEPTTSTSALEALQASFESAKTKLRDAQSALVEVGASLRDALKEERQRRTEAESVRSTLRKLQSIRV